MNKKKSIKTKIASLLAGVLSIALLAGCSQSNTANSETKDEKVYKIGITQFADHPSLDNCKNGFIAGLKDEGFEEGKNIEIESVSAQADMNRVTQISQSFANGNKDLVCGIATPSAQSLYSLCYEKGIPVIFNAVSDPVEAKLAKSKTENMPGVTGVSDELPVEDQLKLIRDVLPDAKKIGILYTTSEANSISTIKTYKELASKYGFEIVDKGITKQAEIPQVLDVLLSQVDCISNLTDNTVVAVLGVVLDKANAQKIPVFGSEEEQVKNGCIASAGLDYFNLGKQTGVIAARVLKGEDISKINYETVAETKYTINENTAKALGIEIPESVKALVK